MNDPEQMDLGLRIAAVLGSLLLLSVAVLAACVSASPLAALLVAGGAACLVLVATILAIFRWRASASPCSIEAAEDVFPMAGACNGPVRAPGGMRAGIDAPYVISDASDRLAGINARMLDRLGLPGLPGEYLGQRLSVLMYGEEERATITRVCVRDGRPYEGVMLNLVSPSGRRVCAWVDASPIHDAEGRIAGAIAVITGESSPAGGRRQVVAGEAAPAAWQRDGPRGSGI